MHIRLQEGMALYSGKYIRVVRAPTSVVIVPTERPTDRLECANLKFSKRVRTHACMLSGDRLIMPGCSLVEPHCSAARCAILS